MAKDLIADLMEETCRKYTERQLGVKLTKRQFTAYCKAVGEQEHRDEIVSAIWLLERNGYVVTKGGVDG